jgi:hypothetical protein
MKGSPIATVRIPAADKAELEAKARKAGVSLGEAMREGAKLYFAITAVQNRKGARAA